MKTVLPFFFAPFLVIALLLAARPALAQVDNDDCSGATTLEIGADPSLNTPVLGLTTEATASIVGNNGCYPQAKDVWYRFVATGASVSLSIVRVYGNAQPADFFFEVYDGTCGDLHFQHYYCRPNESYTVGLGDLQPGAEYWIRVGNPVDLPIGFYISLSRLPPPPLNDACINAIAIPVAAGATSDTLVAGTTAGITASSSAPFCNNCYPAKDMWYRFDATRTAHTICLRAITDSVPGIDRLSVLLYEGDCGQLVNLNRSVIIETEGTIFLNRLQAGKTYFVRLLDEYGRDFYPIHFNIGVATPDPEPYETCAGALPLAPDTALYCQNSLQGSLQNGVITTTACDNKPANNIWYSFVATRTVHLLTLAPYLQDSSLGFELFKGDCAQGISLMCKQGNSIYHMIDGLEIGARYNIRVFSTTVEGAGFSICLGSFPPPPPHDDCAGALFLPVNDSLSCEQMVTGSTLGADSSPSGCTGIQSARDVWYHFTATGVSMRMRIYLQGDQVGDNEAWGYDVFRGTCDSLLPVVCGRSAPDYLEEQLLGGLTPGETYYIRVYSLPQSAHTFDICLQALPDPPHNTSCERADTLVSVELPNCGGSAFANTLGITELSAGACGAPGKSLWYTFIATAPIHTLKVNLLATYLHAFPYRISVYAGKDCTPTDTLYCVENPEKIHLQHLTVGERYYIQWTSNVASGHAFTLCLSHFPASPNDDCAQARYLYPYPDLNCRYPGAETTVNSTPGQPDTCFAGSDVWYTFVATQATHRVELFGITDLNGQTQTLPAELLQGDCGSLQVVYCWPNGLTGIGTLYMGDLIPGQQYYLRLAGKTPDPLFFNICLLTPPLPPVNDNCADATVLIPQPFNDCNSMFGTTRFATATNRLPVPGCCGRGDVWYRFTAANTNHTVALTSVYEELSFPVAGSLVMELYADSCEARALLGVGEGYSGSRWYLSHLQPGATYYLRLYPKDRNSLKFRICIQTPARPLNDDCVAAAALTPGNDPDHCTDLLYLSSEGATQSAPGCANDPVNDVWAVFTAESVAYRIETEAYGMSADGIWGYEIRTSPCDSSASLHCVTVPKYKYIDTLQLRGLVPGRRYFIRFWTPQNEKTYWTCCARVLPAAPVNDACTSATPLAVWPGIACDTLASGTTLGADHSNNTCFGTRTQDVWYRFTATHTAHIAYLKANKSYFGVADMLGYQLYIGDCGQLRPVRCQESLYQDAFVLDSLVPGQTYYWQISSTGYSAHDFTLGIATFPPPPANDNCDNAPFVSSNQDLYCTTVTAGTTIAAGSSASPLSQPDVWYRFTPTNGTHFFQLDHVKTLLGQPGRLRYQLFEGDSCNALRIVYYFDSEKITRLEGLSLEKTYYLRVFSLNPLSAYAFDLCIKTFPPPPPNDDCSGAIVLTPNKNNVCDSITHGSTAGAVNTFTFENGFFEYINDIWYQFTATAPNHQIHVLNLQSLTGAGPGSFELALYSGDSCNALTQIGRAGPQQPFDLHQLTPSRRYYLAAVSRQKYLHEFDICITSDPVPVNDTCGGALPLPVWPGLVAGSAVRGTTLSAAPSATPGCSSGGNDVWFQFVATQAAHFVRVSDAVDPSSANPAPFTVSVFDGECDTLRHLLCRYNLVGADSFPLGDLIPGKAYFMLIGAWPEDLNFEISVSTLPAPPLNDACSGAFPLPVSPGLSCETPVSGTTAYATPSPRGVSYYGMEAVGFKEDVWYVFTATQENHLVKYFNVNSANGSILPEIYTGDCDSLLPVFSVQAFSNEYNLWLSHLTPGNSYYIRVYEPAHGVTTFDLCVTSPPPPASDACTRALPVPVANNFTCQDKISGSTFGATETLKGCDGAPVNDIWYTFVASGYSQRLVVDKETGDGFSNELYIQILEDTCGALKPAFDCVLWNNQALVWQYLKPGHTYYLRFFTPRHNWAQFHFCLQALPAPPANDDCVSAQMIQANTGVTCALQYSGTTLGATPSAPSCIGQATHDVWYRFVVNSEAYMAELKVTGQPFGERPFPIGLQVYPDGACDSAAAMSCLEDYSLIQSFIKNLHIGDTCYLRVFSFQHEALDFSLCARALPPPPDNAVCAGAIPVVVSPNLDCVQPQTGLAANLPDGVEGGCFSDGGLWYQFVATGFEHFIALKNIVPFFGDSISGMELYRGGCGALTRMFCSEGTTPIYAYNLNAGDTYFVRVTANARSAAQFSLCVLTPVPPANDDCAGVIMLPVSLTAQCKTAVRGTNLGATPSAGIFCYSGPDVLYAFVATASEHVVSIFNVSPGISPKTTYMEILGGACGNWNRYWGCYDINGARLSGLEPGQTYYIRLGSFYTTYFNFDICITTPRPHIVAYSVILPFEGCKPKTREQIDVVFANFSNVPPAIDSAEFTLSLSGANQGQYGPVRNGYPFQINFAFLPATINIYVASFYDVDVTKLGETQITATVQYKNGPYRAIDTTVVHYRNEPPYQPYCPIPATSLDEEGADDRSGSEAAFHGLRLAPNPAAHETRLEFWLEQDAGVRYILRDATGRVQRNDSFAGKTGLNQYRALLDGLPAGIYTVELAAGTRRWTKRVGVSPFER